MAVPKLSVIAHAYHRSHNAKERDALRQRFRDESLQYVRRLVAFARDRGNITRRDATDQIIIEQTFIEVSQRLPDYDPSLVSATKFLQQCTATAIRQVGRQRVVEPTYRPPQEERAGPYQKPPQNPPTVQTPQKKPRSYAPRKKRTRAREPQTRGPLLLARSPMTSESLEALTEIQQRTDLTRKESLDEALRFFGFYADLADKKTSLWYDRGEEREPVTHPNLQFDGSERRIRLHHTTASRVSKRAEKSDVPEEKLSAIAALLFRDVLRKLDEGWELIIPDHGFENADARVELSPTYSMYFIECPRRDIHHRA